MTETAAARADMSDLEKTRLCAEAMGWHTGSAASKVVAYEVSECAIIAGNSAGGESVYDPLHDDAQAMALVKRFELQIESPEPQGAKTWWVHTKGYLADPPVPGIGETNVDLNRAIVECVAKMQAARNRE